MGDKYRIIDGDGHVVEDMEGLIFFLSALRRVRFKGVRTTTVRGRTRR